MTMNKELWFPQIIWDDVTHFADNDAIKEWAYEKQKRDHGREISNCGGWQSPDIIFGECQAIDNLIEYLDVQVNICAAEVGLQQLKLGNIWININPPGAYNLLHMHQGSVLSGCYYVDASSEQGDIFFQRNDGAEYHLPDSWPLTQFTASRTSYNVETGALYIFPSWLNHYVESNRTDKDRISIAFNYGEKNDD